LGVPYPEYVGLARDKAKQDAETQAASIAAEFVRQNKGPYRDLRGDEHDLADKQVIALIAYLQRLGQAQTPWQRAESVEPRAGEEAEALELAAPQATPHAEPQSGGDSIAAALPVETASP
ncbi:MAG: hypothetical protein AAF790_06270, partial [Planctomycetota bacterium]